MSAPKKKKRNTVAPSNRVPETRREPLCPGVVYHIYNRGNNGENIFIEERNYAYFLRLYSKYITPIAETYAYCLLRNHFHFLVRIKSAQEPGSCKEPGSSVATSASKQFAAFFGTYTKAINKAYQRSGSLFEGRFKRKPVENDAYFVRLVAYIHLNPERHGFVADYRKWTYSSYQALIGRKATQLARDTVLAWFDGRRGFRQFHRAAHDFASIVDWLGDDL